MRRREVIGLLGGAAVALPRAARGQSPHRVVVLLGFKEIDARAKVVTKPFQAELGLLGWTDGGNVRIVYHWAEGDADRDQIRELSKKLSRRTRT